MNETKWSLDLEITDGPKFKQRGRFPVEGYDKIDVVVPAHSSWQVNVQPAELDAIQLLFILRTDQPLPPAEGEEPADRTLYYTIGDNPNQIELTDHHAVFGSGAAKLLCDTPNEICFDNEGDQDAEITILICRRTSAPCGPGEEPGQEEQPKEEARQGHPEKMQQPPKG